MSDDSIEALCRADHLSAADKKRVGCLCTWEFGDSACPVHPTCPECSARGTCTERNWPCVPTITPEIAARLVAEGAADAAEYRARLDLAATLVQHGADRSEHLDRDLMRLARAVLSLTAERDRLNLEILRLQSDLAIERGRVQGMTETVAFLRSTKEGLF